jgi:hypothetical protein
MLPIVVYIIVEFNVTDAKELERDVSELSLSVCSIILVVRNSQKCIKDVVCVDFRRSFKDQSFPRGAVAQRGS